MASVTMAFVMVTALLVERAQKTRLVTEEYVAWCEQTAARKRAKAARPESPRRKAWGTIAGGLLWSIFSAVGFIPLGLPVLLHFPLWLSHSWEPVPCTILSSEHVRGVGFRYGPTSTFTYRYTFNGQTYTSSEYKLGLIRAGLPADTYRTGQTTTCYVTPRWPGHPVLKMAETWDAVQWMGIAILFAVWQAIGLAILGAGFVLLYRLGAPSG
jgi:hypothetical protein